MRNILYIGGFELPDKNAAAHRVIGNSKVLRTLGYNVNLIGVSKSNDKKTLLETKCSYEGFTYFELSYPKTIYEWIKYITSIEYIDLQDFKPDIIIAYNFPAFALYNLKKYCKKRQIKLIGDCTEWYEPIGSPIHKLIKALDVYFRMEVLHHKLDGLILISSYLSNYYKNHRNVIEIPPLVDYTMTKWRAQLNNVPSESVSLVYAGSPGSGKKDRIDKIIKALSIIFETHRINFVFTIVGITLHEYILAFKLEIPTNIKNFVVFKGRLSHIEALNEIKKSSFNIFLRDDNLTNKAGFPTKFVESITCKTPVITNLTSNIDKYLISGQTGFILNTTDEDKLISSFLSALTVENEVIKKMKESIDSGMFHYGHYTQKFRLLLNKIIQN